MSKILILLRHAEAVDRAASDSDRSRNLTNRGMTQAHQVGQFLSSLGHVPDAVFSSTAARAEQTANIVADALKLDVQRLRLEDDLYDASTRTFFQFVNTLEDDHGTVLCVGHNPAISYLGEYLTKTIIGDMRPAGVTMIRFDIRSWKDIGEGTGKLLQYADPSTFASS